MGHKIYVASSWRNKYQADLVPQLRKRGHEVYDFRNPSPYNRGFHWSKIDSEWEVWDVCQYREALRHPLAENGYMLDMNALDWAEVVILLLPSGRSAHVEAAWHRGKGKPVIVHSPEPCTPELMYKMFNAITADKTELFELLELHLFQLEALSLALFDPAKGGDTGEIAVGYGESAEDARRAMVKIIIVSGGVSVAAVMPRGSSVGYAVRIAADALELGSGTPWWLVDPRTGRIVPLTDPADDYEDRTFRLEVGRE